MKKTNKNDENVPKLTETLFSTYFIMITKKILRTDI